MFGTRRPPLPLLLLTTATGLILFLGASCSLFEKKDDSAAAVDPNADGGTSSGTSGSPEGDGSGVDPEGEDPTDPTPRVRYVGRVDTSDSAHGPRLGWGGTRVLVRFKGSALKAKINEHNIDQGPSAYDVFIDGKLQSDVLTPSEGSASYDLATGLAAGEPHVVELYRRTEGMVAVTQIESFSYPNGGELLAPSAFPNRRIEFLGDSESTGYGVECGSAAEDFSGATENERKAYPSIVARQLNAESHNISYSGKGVFRNQVSNDKQFAKDFYLQSIATYDSDAWTFSKWKPDVVWISLGANDWDAGPNGDLPAPDPGEFKDKYNALVDLVRAKNPAAKIVCAVPGMVDDLSPPGFKTLTNIRSALKAIVDEHVAAGDKNFIYHEHPRATENDLTGCDSHPNAAYHQKLAGSVGPRIAAIMNWQ